MNSHSRALVPEAALVWIESEAPGARMMLPSKNLPNDGAVAHEVTATVPTVPIMAMAVGAAGRVAAVNAEMLGALAFPIRQFVMVATVPVVAAAAMLVLA